MILLDTDVLIDLLRRYAPAVEWFDALPVDEEIVVPGYVVMELIQGCRNKAEQERVQRELASCGSGTIALSLTSRLLNHTPSCDSAHSR